MPKPKNTQKKGIKCEGMRRHGGVFTLGMPYWEECKNDAVVMLRMKQKDEKGIQNMPACMDCWTEAQNPQWGIKILSAKPLKEKKQP